MFSVLQSRERNRRDQPTAASADQARASKGSALRTRMQSAFKALTSKPILLLRIAVLHIACLSAAVADATVNVPDNLLPTVSATASVTTHVNTTPNNFHINPKYGVPRSSVRVSDNIAVTGIGVAVPMSIIGGEYSIGGGAFAANQGTIANGQNMAVRLISSANYETRLLATLTVGGVSANFDATTNGTDDQRGAARSAHRGQ